MESLFSIRHVFFSLRFGSTKTYRKNLISHDLNNTGCVVEFLRMAKHEEYIEGLKNIDSEIDTVGLYRVNGVAVDIQTIR